MLARHGLELKGEIRIAMEIRASGRGSGRTHAAPPSVRLSVVPFGSVRVTAGVSVKASEGARLFFSPTLPAATPLCHTGLCLPSGPAVMPPFLLALSPLLSLRHSLSSVKSV